MDAPSSAEVAARSRTRDRVAVVVVHGVGDHQPRESARAIGDLLQNIDVDAPIGGDSGPPCSELPGKVKPRYDPFLERSLRINVRPVVITGDEETSGGGVRGPFHEWVHKERPRRARSARSSEKPGAYEDWVSFQFMRGQLRCYLGEGPENTYETIRLEGKRTAHGGATERTVHVYELYWSDLSRFKSSLLSVFTELYQVIFHLSSLGTHVVDSEALHHSHVSWGWWRRLQSWAAVCLTVPIPIINLFMLAVAGAAAGFLAFERLKLAIQAEVAISLAAAAVVAAGGFVLWRARNKSVGKWAIPVFLWVGLAVVAWSVITQACGGYDWQLGDGRCEPLVAISRTLASLFLAAAAGTVATIALVAYNQRRPGVTRWARWLAAILFPAALATFAWAGAPTPADLPTSPDAPVFIDTAALLWFRLFEFLYVAVMVAWSAFAALAIAAWGAGVWALKNVSSPADTDRAARGRWTARLMLSLPAFSFLILTLVGWGLIETALERLLPRPIAYTPTVMLFPTTTVQDLLHNLWTYGGGPTLPILLTVGLIAGIPAIWGLAPVVWCEVRPPDFQKSRQAGYAERLGEWLTVTFSGLRISGRLLYLTMTFVVPLVVGWIVLAWLMADLSSQIGDAGRSTRAFLGNFQVLGSISGALIAWLFAMRGQLKKAALGFRTAVDVLVDVDNWLREHPLDSNPKARICGRYVSLLRYICSWRDPFEPAEGYDAIVIVAHSQGTVISADLLRFLKQQAAGNLRDYDPELEPLQRMRIALFTMGCPLRDLYGLRFPRLYGWARHEDEAAMAGWAPNDLVAGPREPPGPVPHELLAVKLWVNAYRSGDYVGRFLWRTRPCGYLWASDLGGMPVDAVAQSVSSDGVARLEFCIGAGAHTHYWDRTAPTIGVEVDRLIAL